MYRRSNASPSLFLVFFLITPFAWGETTTACQVVRGAKPSVVDQQERPFVLLSRAHLEKLREQVAPGGDKHAEYTISVKENAERWLSREVAIPQRAGHFHHFACTDGTRFPTPVDQVFKKPTTGTMEFVCPACNAVYRGEKYDAAMRHAEHTWLIAACRDLALAGRLEKREDYLRKSAEILRRYADAYPGRHTSATTGGMYYQSLDEAVHFIALAHAYDLLYDQEVLTAADKKHIEQDLFWESAEGLIKCGIGGNWGSWHLASVGVIGFATKHQRLIDHALQSFQQQIEQQLGDDGLWPESVHTYHFYPMRAFLHLAEAAANAGTDLYSWEAKPGKGLQAMFTAPLRYMYPNFQLPAINDGWFYSFLPLDIYHLGYRRYGLNELGWAVSELKVRGAAAVTKSPDAVALWTLLHEEEVPDGIPSPVFDSTNFPVLGIATLRQPETASTSQTMMTFDYGRHYGHGQADKMGITLFARGKLLLADYGTPSYGAAILPYYVGTTSHNTIRIDGKDQRRTTDSKLMMFDNTPGPQVASAYSDQVAPGVNWQRTVALTPVYALVVDDLSSSESHVYDSFIHSEGEWLGAVPPVSRSLASTESLALQYCSAAEQLQASDGQLLARWTGGGLPGGVTLRVSGPRDSRYFRAECPAETGTRTISTVMSRVEGRNARLVHLLAFGQTLLERPLPTLQIVGEQITVQPSSLGGSEGVDTFVVSSAAVRFTGADGSQKLVRASRD